MPRSKDYENTTVESLQLYLSFRAAGVKYRGVGSRKIKLLLSHFSIGIIIPLRTKSLVDALWIYVNDLPIEERKIVLKHWCNVLLGKEMGSTTTSGELIQNNPWQISKLLFRKLF